MSKKTVLKTIGIAAGSLSFAGLTVTAIDHSYFRSLCVRTKAPRKNSSKNTAGNSGNKSVDGSQDSNGRSPRFTMPFSLSSMKELKINRPRYKFEEIYEADRAWIAEQPVEDIYIRSEDGIKLHASYMHCENPERILILSHGYRTSAAADFANIIPFLHENNCDLLLMDQRGCGLSEGRYITFGALESKDVLLWAEYADSRNKADLPIFLYGISMGGTAVLLAAENDLPDSVKGLIIDCAFHSMKDEVTQVQRNWYHMPPLPLFLKRIDFLCRTKAGFAMKDTDTTRALFRNTRPILFFHGGKDTFVTPDHSRTNYALCGAPKELVIMDEARHLCCSYEEPERYRDKVMEFFDKYDG